MATSPSILDQLKNTGGAIMDALRAKYAGGPAGMPLTPGPGSVLDQRDTQMQPLLPAAQPLVPTHLEAPNPSSPMNNGAYGTKPGEKRIDVSEYISGLSGVKRK